MVGPGVLGRNALATPPSKMHSSAPRMDSQEAKITKAPERVLDRLVLHASDGERRVVDPADVYYLEAPDEDTLVRLRSARPLVDMRPIRELLPLFVHHGFQQIHREYVVNLRRAHLIRRRDEGLDWDVKLEPPVNRVLPVSRGALTKLWRAFGRIFTAADVSAETSLGGGKPRP